MTLSNVGLLGMFIKVGDLPMSPAQPTPLRAWLEPANKEVCMFYAGKRSKTDILIAYARVVKSMYDLAEVVQPTQGQPNKPALGRPPAGPMPLKAAPLALMPPVPATQKGLPPPLLPGSKVHAVPPPLPPHESASAAAPLTAAEINALIPQVGKMFTGSQDPNCQPASKPKPLVDYFGCVRMALWCWNQLPPYCQHVSAFVVVLTFLAPSLLMHAVGSWTRVTLVATWHELTATLAHSLHVPLQLIMAYGHVSIPEESVHAVTQTSLTVWCIISAFRRLG